MNNGSCCVHCGWYKVHRVVGRPSRCLLCKRTQERPVECGNDHPSIDALTGECIRCGFIIPDPPAEDLLT